VLACWKHLFMLTFLAEVHAPTLEKITGRRTSGWKRFKTFLVLLFWLSVLLLELYRVVMYKVKRLQQKRSMGLNRRRVYFPIINQLKRTATSTASKRNAFILEVVLRLMVSESGVEATQYWHITHSESKHVFVLWSWELPIRLKIKNIQETRRCPHAVLVLDQTDFISGVLKRFLL